MIKIAISNYLIGIQNREHPSYVRCTCSHTHNTSGGKRVFKYFDCECVDVSRGEKIVMKRRATNNNDNTEKSRKTERKENWIVRSVAIDSKLTKNRNKYAHSVCVGWSCDTLSAVQCDFTHIITALFIQFVIYYGSFDLQLFATVPFFRQRNTVEWCLNSELRNVQLKESVDAETKEEKSKKR